MTDIFDVFRTAWRHRVVALIILANVMAATVVYLVVQKPLYQSTLTLQLASDGTDTAFLAQVNSLTPLYSTLLSSPQTLTVAQNDLGTRTLGQVTVLTFTDSPVIKVNVTSESADTARASAGAVLQGLNDRLAVSKLGVPGITVSLVDGPSQADMSWPRPALTVGVAAVIGLLLALLGAWLMERWRPRRPVVAPAARPAATSEPAPVRATERPRVPGARDARSGTSRRPLAGGPATFSMDDLDGPQTGSDDGGTPAEADVFPPSGAAGDVSSG
jgi:capsular polysaccharide biosynthesis protein